MERSEIRGSRNVVLPGLRCAPSGLRTQDRRHLGCRRHRRRGAHPLHADRGCGIGVSERVADGRSASQLRGEAAPAVHAHDLDADPFVQFQRWYDDAQEHGQLQPDAMVVATSTLMSGISRPP